MSPAISPCMHSRGQQACLDGDMKAQTYTKTQRLSSEKLERSPCRGLATAGADVSRHCSMYAFGWQHECTDS